MGTLSMKVLIVLVSVLACAVAQNVVCGKGTTNKEVTVEDKKTYTFKTQKGKKYLPNTDCTVNYKMGHSCKKMSFACTKFNTFNKDKKKCMKGDKLTITANGKSKAYCKKQKKGQPKVSSTGDLSLVFTSDKSKKRSTGAVCKVRCTEASSGSTGPDTTLYRGDLSSYPLALCNDGTTATYYYSGDIQTSGKLLLYMQGGGACGSVEECARRCNNQESAFRCTTSNNQTIDESYTFWSSDQDKNPPFHDFAKVFMHYCSSDAWQGSRDAGEETGGYHFHGKDIVNAILDDLIATKINIDQMEQVVLLGTSAGAMGVQGVCDSVADTFKAENNDIDARCIADSGDLVPTIGQDCNTEEQVAAGLEFYGAELDPSCTGSLLECKLFSSSYQFINTPLMVVHDYIDPVVTGPCAPEVNVENQGYWSQWMQQVYQLSMQFIQDKPANGLFVPRCFFHVLAKNDKAWSGIEVPVVGSDDTVLLKDIINNWLTGAGPYQAIDNPSETNQFCSGGTRA